MTLIPNPYYHGRKPHIRIVASALATDEVNYRDYVAGGVDVTRVPIGDVPAVQNQPGFHRLLLPSVQFILPNLQSPPFSNIHCRLALAYATDRATIGDKVLHGALHPLYAIVPPGFVGYYAGNDNPHYNPAKAAAELKQCPGGIHNVKLDYWKVSSDSDTEFAALQYTWGKLGIGVTLNGMPLNPWLNVYTQPLSKTGTSLLQGEWSADYPDPEDFYRTLLYTGAGYNPGPYNNPEYDALVNQGDVTFNRAKRAQLYIKAAHLAIGDGALITLGQEVSYALVKPYVHGLVSAPFLYPTIEPKGNVWANVTISPH
jgi:oligopeptide transport system substrate-binding protein